MKGALTWKSERKTHACINCAIYMHARFGWIYIYLSWSMPLSRRWKDREKESQSYNRSKLAKPCNVGRELGIDLAAYKSAAARIGIEMKMKQ